jgi:hypothetical protein
VQHPRGGKRAGPALTMHNQAGNAARQLTGVGTAPMEKLFEALEELRDAYGAARTLVFSDCGEDVATDDPRLDGEQRVALLRFYAAKHAVIHYRTARIELDQRPVPGGGRHDEASGADTAPVHPFAASAR